MSAHLTFEEMVSFLNLKNISEETRGFAFRINMHLMRCCECYSCYRVLLDLNEQIDLMKLSDVSEEQYVIIENLLIKDGYD